MVVVEDAPVKLLSASAVALAPCLEEKVVHRALIFGSPLKVVYRTYLHHFDDANAFGQKGAKLTAEVCRLMTVELYEVEREERQALENFVGCSIDEDTHTLCVLRHEGRHLADMARGARVEDEPHPVDRCELIHSPDVVCFPHAAHLDDEMLAVCHEMMSCIKSLRAEPGSAVFMKVSPMRNPLKPAFLSSLTVSALDMPLSLTNRKS